MPEHAEIALTVIVPMYRQWQFLPDLLVALQRQSYDLIQHGEVLLVDNEPDASRPKSELPHWVRLVSCSKPGSYAARNLGASFARGRLLVFTDADCRPHRDWLLELSRADRRGILAGPVDIPLPDKASVWQIFDSVRGIPQARFIQRGYAATANLAVSREIFRVLGGFDERRLSGGDAEFCRRAGRLKYGLTLVPRAIVDHPARDSFAALMLKARRIKGGQVASGPLMRRIFWLLRSLMPPFRESGEYLLSDKTIRYRLIAIAVRFLLWGVELKEVARLVVMRAPRERR